MQDAIGGSSKKENDGTDNHWIKIHEMTVALPANPNPAGRGALHYR
jgi:hypothetical protein